MALITAGICANVSLHIFFSFAKNKTNYDVVQLADMQASSQSVRRKASQIKQREENLTGELKKNKVEEKGNAKVNLLEMH